MKTIKLALASIMLLAITTSYAQTKGNGKVTKQDRKVSNFNAIDVGCVFNVFITQGSEQSLQVQTDENLQDLITAKTENGTLILSCKKIEKPTKLDVYITTASLSKLKVSGAAKVTGQNLIKNDNFELYTSGACEVTMDIESEKFKSETSGASKTTITLNAKTANTEISGAGNLSLNGTAKIHNTEISGAGKLKAKDFKTENTNAEVSGAGDAKVMVQKTLNTDVSGAGSISYTNNDKTKTLSKKGKHHISF